MPVPHGRCTRAERVNMNQHHAAWLERHADRDGAWLKPCRMSAIGGKADVRGIAVYIYG